MIKAKVINGAASISKHHCILRYVTTEDILLSPEKVPEYVAMCRKIAQAKWNIRRCYDVCPDISFRQIVRATIKPVCEIYGIHFPFDWQFYKIASENWEHFHDENYICSFIDNFIDYIITVDKISIQETGTILSDSQMQYHKPENTI